MLRIDVSCSKQTPIKERAHAHSGRFPYTWVWLNLDLVTLKKKAFGIKDYIPICPCPDMSPVLTCLDVFSGGFSLCPRLSDLLTLYKVPDRLSAQTKHPQPHHNTTSSFEVPHMSITHGAEKRTVYSIQRNRRFIYGVMGSLWDRGFSTGTLAKSSIGNSTQ